MPNLPPFPPRRRPRRRAPVLVPLAVAGVAAAALATALVGAFSEDGLQLARVPAFVEQPVVKAPPVRVQVRDARPTWGTPLTERQI